ncbi:hypothetical protein HNQ09_002585 [Deinococcus budaensis]|uniref:Uncharacterized protein n=1 Tax=Deinococcus budaensis TaxID=1665626 RepID=A0A7W8GGD9_9DEIO|nr:hypothetical protein [Deinococcus budaensis]
MTRQLFIGERPEAWAAARAVPKPPGWGEG